MLETFLLIVIIVAAVALEILRRNRATKSGRAGKPMGDGSSPAGHDRAGDSGDDAAVKKPRKPKAAAKRNTGDVDTPEAVPASHPTKTSPAAERGPGPGHAPLARQAVGTGAFEGVRTWGYQLQKVVIGEVAASAFDVMVVDYSRDGSDDEAFTREEVAAMQTKADGSRRLVLAYMSIGEAESYRYYWDPAWSVQKPAWMLDENPDWKENYSVCFWEPGWQAAFYGKPTSYLDKVLAAGFDGVYLDKCDVFEDLQARNKRVAASRPDLEGDMVSFISRLSHYAKARVPTFAIVMQNAEVLLEHEHLRQVIDGVAKECLLYGLTSAERLNPRDEITFSRRALDLAKSAGRTVFAVEYMGDAAKIRSAMETLDGYGYIATVSPKNKQLNRLNSDPATV